MAKDVNASEWDEVITNSKKPVFVDYWHEQCVWCNRLAPVYEELSNEFDDADFAKLNIRATDENLKLAQEHGIMSTPTIKVFCNGREVGETVGFMEKDALRTELTRLLEVSDACHGRSEAA